MVRAPDLSRWRVHLLWLAVALAAAACTWWAATALLAPSGQGESTQASAPTYTAVMGEVGVAAAAQASVVFQQGPTGIAGVSGTVTTLSVNPAVPIAVGDTLVTVDLRPVVAALGTIPAFRDLAVDMRGPDVRQLRAFLGVGDSDYFDWKTRNAVRVWQKQLGLAADGVVHRGDILFLGSFPARGFAAEDIAVGSSVSAGQPLLTTVLPLPQIRVPADAGGKQFVAGMHTRVFVGARVLEGTLIGPFRGPDGLLAFTVVGEDGASVCDAECAAAFSITSEGQVSIEVDIVPRSTGVVVPDAALAVLPGGGTAVRTVDGEFIDVEVLTSGQGLSIVEGLEPGTIILLFAADDSP